VSLSFRGITKSYGGIRALGEVGFDVAAGEVHAVVGANGAGKSTLMKILTGVVQPDAGVILLEGRPLRIRSPLEAHRLGIGLVPQETTLCDNLSIAENVYLGRTRWLRPRALAALARSRLEALGLDYEPLLAVARLSVAQKQLVQIVRALAYEPRILALDEPTSSLSEAEVETLFRVLRGLRDRGVTVLFVSHRLREVQTIADRATVLRDGRFVATVPAGTTPREEIVRLMAGHEVAGGRASAGAPGEEVLEVRGLSGKGFRDVSFVLKRGEVLGWFGLVGAGRTEAARALFGIDPAEAGEIRLHGRTMAIRSPVQAIEAGIGMVPEDRKLQGLVLQMRIAPNLSLASLGRLTVCGAISGAREGALVQGSIDRLRIRCEGGSQPVGELSGGNQQKVVLARWLETRPRVLILDEPTKGVDVAAKAEIQGIVRELVRGGGSVLLISSELEEIRELADRVLVFRAGRVSAEFPGGASDGELMAAAT
jgi:ABC-type sugar transport system ATPase subunit